MFTNDFFSLISLLSLLSCVEVLWLYTVPSSLASETYVTFQKCYWLIEGGSAYEMKKLRFRKSHALKQGNHPVRWSNSWTDVQMYATVWYSSVAVKVHLILQYLMGKVSIVMTSVSAPVTHNRLNQICFPKVMWISCYAFSIWFSAILFVFTSC